MRFSHPDAAIRAYADAIEHSGAPSRSVVAHGREYERTCGKPGCRKARQRAKDAAKKAGEPVPEDWVQVFSREAAALVYRCAYCMRVRQWVDAYILGGQGSGGRKGRPPSAVVRAGDMAPISALVERMADELGDAPAAVYVWYAAHGKSMDLTALDVSEALVGGRHWSESDVRRCVRTGRAWLERQLTAAGLYRRPAYKPRRLACPSEC